MKKDPRESQRRRARSGPQRVAAWPVFVLFICRNTVKKDPRESRCRRALSGRQWPIFVLFTYRNARKNDPRVPACTERTAVRCSVACLCAVYVSEHNKEGSQGVPVPACTERTAVRCSVACLWAVNGSEHSKEGSKGVPVPACTERTAAAWSVFAQFMRRSTIEKDPREFRCRRAPSRRQCVAAWPRRTQGSPGAGAR